MAKPIDPEPAEAKRNSVECIEDMAERAQQRHGNVKAPARRLSSETGPNVCGSGINDLHNVTINQHWRAVPDP